MARPKQLPPGIGHNHRDLTDDEMGALVTSFTTKLIDGKRKLDALMVDVKSARTHVNGLFKQVKKETGYDRDEFEEEVIANLDRSEDEIRAEQARRTKLQILAGLREGDQLDLVALAQADTVDDAIAAEAAGYRAGRRGDEPVRPGHIDTFFEQDWQRGWIRGQEVNAKADALAAEILARPKPGEMAAAEDEEEAEEDPADPAVIRKKANALKDSGWTEPTAEEAAFEMAH